MQCHVCNAGVGDGQKFCHECGQSLSGVTDSTEAHDVIFDESESPLQPVFAEPDASTGAEDEPRRSDDFGPPDVTDAIDESSTEPIHEPDAEPTTPDAALIATKAMVIVPMSEVTTGSGSSSIPDGGGNGGSTDDPFASSALHEPTTDMAVTHVPAGAVSTDEHPITDRGGMNSTAKIPIVESGSPFDDGDNVARYDDGSDRFRLRVTVVLSILALGATLMAMSNAADVIDIRTSRPVGGILPGIQRLDDFGTNLGIAGLIGCGLMMLGAIISCFGVRWGAGMAGGAGLSLAGWAAITLGLAERPIHTAEGEAARDSAVDFTLSVTRDLGYFLILSIGAVGVLAFLASLRLSRTAGRPGLNPWIAAVGALGAVVLAAGPLITLGGAPLDANLSAVGTPREFFAARLVQLGLLVVTGVIGFLSVRTYGLGLVAGGMGVATWMWITSFIEFGDRPVSIAVGNLGTSDTMPHAVTSVGVTATLAMLLIASTVALASRSRN